MSSKSKAGGLKPIHRAWLRRNGPGLAVLGLGSIVTLWYGADP